MKKTAFITFILMLLCCISVSAADSMIFNVSREYDRLTIEGTYIAQEWVSAEITAPNNSNVYKNSVKCDSEGHFIFGYLFGKDDKSGVYKLRLMGNELKEYDYEYLPSDKCNITAFAVNGVSADISGNAISLTLPYTTDRNNLTPTFTASDKARVYVADELQKSGESSNNFVESVEYKVVAEDKSYKVYTVTISLTKAPTKTSSGGGGGGGGASSYKADTVITQKPVLEPAPIPAAAEAPTALGNIFADIPSDYWAAGFIEYLSGAGIINGTGNGNFDPEAPITREEFAKIICNAFYIDPYEDQDEDFPFTDVDFSSWYAPYVAALYYEELINGVSDTVFGVGESITRQDMAVIIYRCCDYAGPTLTENKRPFDDNGDIADYAAKAVRAMRGSGIINGVSNNVFAPKQTTTRAQSAKVIYSVMYLNGDIEEPEEEAEETE